MTEVADFFLRTPNLTASNFAALWLTDLKFSASKDLSPFSKCVKFQEATSILRLGFALSKWSHFDSVYLPRGRFVLLSIVDSKFEQTRLFVWIFISSGCFSKRCLASIAINIIKRAIQGWKMPKIKTNFHVSCHIYLINKSSSHFDFISPIQLEVRIWWEKWCLDEKMTPLKNHN